MKKNDIISIFLMMLLSLSLGCGAKKAKPTTEGNTGPIIPVLTARAELKSVPLIIKSVGRVEAYKSIPVYSKVSGQLLKVHFKEGQIIKAGDPLFSINPNIYTQKVKEAEADLEQVSANMTYNLKQAERQWFLFKKGVIAKIDYESAKRDYEVQKNIFLGKKASLEQAKINLRECTITAPFAGKTGAYLISEGGQIIENQTKLLQINQLTPVKIVFSVTESELSQLRFYAKKNAIKVGVYLTGQPESTQRTGTLEFIDNEVDPTSGQIMLKALIPNADLFFWPGQSVNINLILISEKGLIIPISAVQISQADRFVYVVTANSTVEYRKIQIDRNLETETVIKSGLTPGEIVVTDGQLKLMPGMKVEIKKGLE